MAVTDTTLPEPVAAGASVADSTRSTPGELEVLVGTADHTTLGRLYIGFALCALVAALVVRVLVGIDLVADNGIFGSSLTMVDQSSAVALLFMGVAPALLGLAMVIVPLQVGAPSIAFARAASLSLWTWLVSAVIFIVSIAIDGGLGGGDYDASVLGNLSFAAMMAAIALGSICVATTVLTHRPAGMTLARVPLFAWSMLVAASVWILTIGAALAHSLMGQVANDSAGGLAENFTNGLSWLLRGPAVYMVAIPLLGIAGDAVARTTGRRLRNYGMFQALIALFGVLSFGAWAQGPESLNTFVWALWALGAALPVLGLLGGLAETLRYGSPKASPALLGSFLGLLALLGAILVGVLMALDTAGKGTLFDFEPAALGGAQSAFVVTAALAALLVGLVVWSPQLWGSPAPTSSANGAAVLVFVGGVVFSVALAVWIFLIANDVDGDQALGVFQATGALLMGMGLLGAIAAAFNSSRTAREGASDRDAGGMTLEWQVPWPAIAAERTAELPESVDSPYPLADDSQEG